MTTSDSADSSLASLSASTAASEEMVARARRWRLARGWSLHWEFWLALALGAFLRLWRLDVTQFLDDQTGMMTLARDAFLHGALPVTSIPSSIGSLNPPLSTYFLMPFAAFTSNPLPAVISVALCNTLAVALCYIFCLRYFGRVVAATGALLFATNSSVINYNRFLWPPNYLPLLLTLWAFTLYAGAVRGRRGWLVPNVGLLAAAVLLHPTAALLAPVTLVAIVLAPQRPRIKDYVGAVIVVLILLLPSLLWELVSHGFDLRPLAHYAKQGGHFDLQVFYALFGAVNGPGSGDLGAVAPYAAFGPMYLPLTILVAVLIGLGYIALTAFVVAPALGPLRRDRSAESAGARAGLGGLWLRLRGDAQWRAHLLLWIWITLPIIALIHHSAQLYAHYLIILYPALFIPAGFAVRWVLARQSRRAQQVTRGSSTSQTQPSRRGTRALGALVVALLALVVVGQTLRSALYPASLVSGQFVASAGYGYPLGATQGFDGELATMERAQGVATTYISLPANIRYRAPLEYLLVSEHANRVGVSSGSLLLPDPATGPALEVAEVPNARDATLLATLPNAQLITDVPVSGGPPIPVFRIQGTTPLLSDERRVAPVTFQDARGDKLRLDAAAIGANGVLRLRWTVLSAAPAELATGDTAQPWFRIQAQDNSSATGAYVDCQPTNWQAGETLFTWLTLPQGGAGSGGTIAISARSGTHGPGVSTLGPLRLLSFTDTGAPLTDMRAKGTNVSGGVYMLTFAGK